MFVYILINFKINMHYVTMCIRQLQYSVCLPACNMWKYVMRIHRYTHMLVHYRNTLHTITIVSSLTIVIV